MIASLASQYRLSGQQRQALVQAERSGAQSRRRKLFLLFAIGIVFWFSVPYSLPIQLDSNPLKAATAESEAYSGSLSRQLAMPALLLISAYALWRFPVRLRPSPGWRLIGLSALYLLWAGASVLWSDDPRITLKRLVVLLINGLFCYTLARRATMREIAVLGFVCTGGVALLSVYADVVLLHAFAPGDPDYRFMGVMTANYQAMNLFVCLLCGLTLLQRQPRWLPWLAPALAGGAALLFLTRARISTLLFLPVLVLVFFRMARQTLSAHGRALILLVVGMGVLPAAAFVLGQAGGQAVGAAFMMGRSDTESTASLSNRAPLWQELWKHVEERPVLGVGYDAFWTPQRVEQVSVDQGWVVPHAHNTYLDQTLSLGVVGAVLYLSCLWAAFAVAWQRYRRCPGEDTLLPAVLLSYLALLSFTESIPIAPHLPTLLAYACVLRMGFAAETAAVGGESGSALPGGAFAPESLTATVSEALWQESL